MARLKLELHPEAALELERSYDYYASRSFVAADPFVHEIDAAIDGILEIVDDGDPALRSYRRVIVEVQ